MTVSYDSTDFFIAGNTTLGYQWRYANEAYRGPIVLGAVPQLLNWAMNGSLGHVRFTSTNPDGLTSRCFYHFTVTNGNTVGLWFRTHAANS
ncbi:hypothetical protein [Nonomuraea lactucae]|uniref:hypothetical protein n=1 Tax=Nonomuraea lactucae TaxID=2249762 RepID=UPI0013B39C1E|nr:hypothetical protein [Nonomuraea lactucae]